MMDSQAMSLKAIAEQHKSFFLPRMIRIINQTGVIVQKNRLGFFE